MGTGRGILGADALAPLGHRVAVNTVSARQRMPRHVVPATRRAEGAKGDRQRGVSYGRPVCSRNELATVVAERDQNTKIESILGTWMSSEDSPARRCSPTRAPSGSPVEYEGWCERWHGSSRPWLSLLQVFKKQVDQLTCQEQSFPASWYIMTWYQTCRLYVGIPASEVFQSGTRPAFQ